MEDKSKTTQNDLGKVVMLTKRALSIPQNAWQLYTVYTVALISPAQCEFKLVP